LRVLNESVVSTLRLQPELIDRVARLELQQLARQEHAYRLDRPPIDVRGRVVILVDDGLATGASMRVAVAALRGRGPARLVVAVPTAPSDTCGELEQEVDEVVCAVTPEPFMAVGLWYEDFSQTTDEEVEALLQKM
jgi:predicted phosphoribosyltransferase